MIRELRRWFCLAQILPVFFIGSVFAQVEEPVSTKIPDMKEDHWAKKDVDKLVARGVIKLSPDGNFNGKKKVDRYDMAVVISRTLQEIDENGAKDVTQEEIAELKRTLKLITEEVMASRADVESLENDHKMIMEQNRIIDHKLYKLGNKLAKVEGKLSPVVIKGDWRVRYQHTSLNVHGTRGSSTNDGNQFRLSFKGSLDPTMYVFGRVRMTQPMARKADSSTDFGMDLFYLHKKDLWGGDWQAGRQFLKHGQGMLFLNFFDGIMHFRDINDRLRFTGGVLAETNAANVTVNKTHGLQANMLALEYQPNEDYSITLTSFVQNAETDKFGVFGTNTPTTKEGWVSADFKGKINDKLELFGVAATYRNQLDATNTKPAEKHLRGDIDRAGYMVGADYNWTKKFRLGAIWALHEDNFRAFSVLSDTYWLLNQYHHPLEDSLTALGLQANLPGKAAETIYPVDSAAAAPYNSPLGKIGDNRPKWNMLQDIHGYKDLQVTGNYAFTRRLSLRLSGAWMTPAKSKYRYADVFALTTRLNYSYNPTLNIELRGVRVTSDYGRSMNDWRTEVYARF